MSSHGVISCLLLPAPKRVLSVVHIGSLSLESDEIMKTNSVISLAQRKNAGRGEASSGKQLSSHSESSDNDLPFQAQDGRHRQLRTQNNEELLPEAGLNIFSVFPSGSELPPRRSISQLLARGWAFTASARLQTPACPGHVAYLTTVYFTSIFRRENWFRVLYTVSETPWNLPEPYR